jgi:hypothetical protein
MRIGFGMRQALKRKNVPLGMLRAIEDQLNASFSQVSVQCSGSSVSDLYSFDTDSPDQGF